MSDALAVAIERKALELGVWETDDGPGIVVHVHEDGTYVARPRPGPDVTLSPIDAAAWLLALESGHTIEAACPDCEARGGGWKVASAQSEDGRPFHGRPSCWMEPAATRLDTVEMPLHMAPRKGCVYASLWVRPCPTCTVDGEPTGRVHVPAHERLLAALKPVVHQSVGFGSTESESDAVAKAHAHAASIGAKAVIREVWKHRDGVFHASAGLHYVEEYEEARDDITVLAERLMLEGDPLGELLALRMAGKLEARHVMGVEIVDIRVGWHGDPYERPALVAQDGAS